MVSDSKIKTVAVLSGNFVLYEVCLFDKKKSPYKGE